MSTGQLPEKRPFVRPAIWLAVPIVAGILVDGASESLKFVTHGVSNQTMDRELTLADPLILVLCIVLLVAAILMYERSIEHTKCEVRILFLVLSLVIVGALEPWAVFFNRKPILDSYDKVCTGVDKCTGVDSLTDVQRKFGPASPRVEFHDYKNLNPKGSHIYCAQGCSVRLTYDVPSLWHRSFVYIDFDYGSNSEEPKATFRYYVH
jgi:hypothetical protein